MARSTSTHQHFLPLWMEQTLNSITDAFFSLDTQWRITFLNEEAARILQRPRAELLNQNLWQAFPEAVGSQFYHEYHRAMESGTCVEFTSHYPPLGACFEVRAFPGASGLAVCFRDITERKSREKQYRREARQTRLILDNAMDGILTINKGGIIESFNKTAERIFGYKAEEVLGRSVELLLPEPYRHDYQHYLQEFIRPAGHRTSGIGRESRGRRRNGEVFPMELAISELNSEDYHFFIGMVRDLTEKKKREQAIHQLAHYDALTGLPNRTQLWLDIEHKLESAADSFEHFALAVIDLDNFKDVNDAYGHKVGDGLLVHVAQRIRAFIDDEEAILARFSGDEFIVLSESLGGDKKKARHKAEQIFEQLRERLSEPYWIGEYEHTVTASIGVTLLDSRIAHVEDLVRQADMAMYSAKSAGRNHLSFYHDNMQVEVSHRAGMDAALRQALKRDEFILLYQPQVDAQSKVVGAEALIRWNRSDGTQVSPFEFIPVAEETGFIINLGHWILKEALTQLADWQRQSKTRALRMSINISARQFRRPHFAQEVLCAIQASGADARQLTLELTESHLLQDADTIAHNLMLLKDEGILFSLDDFGTGYSSLSYLKRFPIGEIKIDKSFVMGALKDPNDDAIVRAITQMGKALDLTVVAEGVETEAHFKYLKSINCPLFQGYLFARPMAAAELENQLQLNHTLNE